MIILMGELLSGNNIHKCALKPYHRRYLTKRAEALKTQYHYEAKDQWGNYPPIEDDDIEINIVLYLQDKKRRDCDNHVKLALDSLAGVAYNDDSQIKAKHIFKEYDKDNPRIEISII